MIRIEISEQLKKINVFTDGYDINFINNETDKKGTDTLETKMKKVDELSEVKTVSVNEDVDSTIVDTPKKKTKQKLDEETLLEELQQNLDAECVEWLKNVGTRSFSKWFKNYPLDFLTDEINNAYGWCIDNNKTKRKPGRFLSNWFDRSDNPLKNGKQLEDIFTTAIERGNENDMQSH